MSFRATILTLYPDMFPGHLGLSLAGRALERGDASIEPVNIRDFATDKHRSVDDTPAGGGAGMVLKPDVLASAIDAVSPEGDTRPRLLMSPRGRPLTQARVRELADGPGAVIVCGRFEGVDQRVIEARGLEEVSIGDYVLSGGEPAALILLDAVIRVLPGVMGNAASGTHESFETGMLEHPHYTRPQVFEGREIPAVLTSGNHKAVEAWREAESLKLTRARRPDLLAEKSPGEARGKPPPQLQGEQILLRLAREQDVADRLALGRDWEIVHMFGSELAENDSYSRSEAQRFIDGLRQHPHAWVIEHEGRFLGEIRLDDIDRQDRRARLAVGLFDPGKLGQGLGREAIMLVLNHAFAKMGLHRVDLRVLSYNARAIRCYQACGFREEGRERQAALVGGKWHDDVIMGILAPEFRAA